MPGKPLHLYMAAWVNGHECDSQSDSPSHIHNFMCHISSTSPCIPCLPPDAEKRGCCSRCAVQVLAGLPASLYAFAPPATV